MKTRWTVFGSLFQGQPTYSRANSVQQCGQANYPIQTWTSCGRLPRIHLENPSMHLSSTSRACSAPQLLSSSTLCMTLSERVRILFVAIHSAFVKVFQQLFLMVSGWTSQIMMHLPNLWSPLRGIPGCHLISVLKEVESQFLSSIKSLTVENYFQHLSGM